MSGARTVSARALRFPALRVPRRAGRLLLALVLLAGLCYGAWLWLRDSSFVRVHDVTVVGVSSSDEARIRATLTDAARDMTTLHVRQDTLRKAVASFPSVAAVKAEADFPHGIQIEVIEHTPVAVLGTDGRGIPVTGGGHLLRGLRTGDLPVISIKADPGGERLTDAKTLAALAIAAAAPADLRERAEKIRSSPRGLEVILSDGPRLIFGGRSDARAKWAAAMRVLAEPSAQGATYLDLRVRGRVAAGGVGPVDPAEEASEDGAAAATATPQANAQP